MVEPSNYRFVANSQLVQYPGTADLASLELTTNTPEGVAGRWNLDVRKSGRRSQVETDAVLVKELKK